MTKEEIQAQIDSIEEALELVDNKLSRIVLKAKVKYLRELKESALSIQDLQREAFEAGREFNSIDGVVDIHIVLNIPNADNSDLQPVYPTFDDYLNTL